MIKDDIGCTICDELTTRVITFMLGCSVFLAIIILFLIKAVAYTGTTMSRIYVAMRRRLWLRAKNRKCKLGW